MICATSTAPLTHRRHHRRASTCFGVCAKSAISFHRIDTIRICYVPSRYNEEWHKFVFPVLPNCLSQRLDIHSESSSAFHHSYLLIPESQKPQALRNRCMCLITHI